jgi:hypothetical protein
VTYNPEYHREYSKRRNLAFREYVGRVKAHFGCSVCGATEDLDFHHVDPATKACSIAHMSNCSLETLWLEIEKCVVACRRCHMVELEQHDYAAMSEKGLRARYGDKAQLAEQQFAPAEAA